MKRKLTYSCPLALYISYYALILLSAALIVLSFQLNLEGSLFLQIFSTGVLCCIISSLLILYSTEIEKKIDAGEWQKSAASYYNDEGDFEYTYNGFKINTWNSGPIEVRWKDIVKIEAHERKINDFMKAICIDIFFSERQFITIDSATKGFQLFEKRLREHLDNLWTSGSPEKEIPQKQSAPKQSFKLS